MQGEKVGRGTRNHEPKGCEQLIPPDLWQLPHKLDLLQTGSRAVRQPAYSLVVVEAIHIVAQIKGFCFRSAI